MAKQKTIEEICWWYAPGFQQFRLNPSAGPWETLRRTKSYPALHAAAKVIMEEAGPDQYNRRVRETLANIKDPLKLDIEITRLTLPFAQSVVPKVRRVPFSKKPPHRSERDWLPLGQHDPVLRWGHLVLAGCSPDLNWVQLGSERRGVVAGVTPFLPRQLRSEGYSLMDVSIRELVRDSKGEAGETITQSAWSGIGNLLPVKAPCFPILPAAAQQGIYVVVTFELGQPSEALERQFKAELTWRLFPDSKQPNLSADRPKYPDLWAETIDPNLHERTISGVLTVPARHPPFAMCWIPANNNLERVLSRFANAVREENRRKLEQDCVTYWGQQQTVALPAAVQEMTGCKSVRFPPHQRYAGLKSELKRKPAMMRCTVGHDTVPKEFWLGLSAYELRARGVRFDRSPSGRSALAFLKRNGEPDDPDLIRPALSAFTGRVREIDKLYSRLF